MSIYSTLTILMYALAPFAWWLTIGTIVLITLHFVAYLRGYQITRYRCYPAVAIAALVGLSALLWIPPMTHSQLSYIATWVDWAVLVSAIIGTAVIAYLVVHPLSFFVRQRT
ncbi:hypothetical protein GLV89_04750 [Halomonas alkaliantarctica]|nr:hypothetical protein [Halomonas alkaliantarctica]